VKINQKQKKSEKGEKEGNRCDAFFSPNLGMISTAGCSW